MYRNLHFKIMLIFIIFTFMLMAVIGAVMLSGAFSFYNNMFYSRMDDSLSENKTLRTQLTEALMSTDSVILQSRLLSANAGALGIGQYRNYYILDMSGNCLARSDALALSSHVNVTPNIIKALGGADGNIRSRGNDFSDYAVYLENGGTECVIYIIDTQEEARSFALMIFQNVAQTLFIGMFFAVALSFFLSRAITSPIKNLTDGAQRISKGEFDYEINVHSKDEIGTLTDTFNNMRDTLKSTLDTADGERKKFESLFLYLNDAVLAFDSEGVPMHINKNAKRLFRFTSPQTEELAGKFTFAKMIKLLSLDYASAADEYRKNKTYTFRGILYDGKAFDITLAEFRYTVSKHGVSGIMCVLHDVTGSFELDRSRREFVADVSHELRTPLTSIKGAVETVLEYPSLDSDTRDRFLNMAVGECDRMARIVGDLLVLSRLDNNKTSWKIETFEPERFIEHIYEVMNVEAGNHGHSFTYTVGEGIPDVTGDKEKLQQVIINVVANAIKYTPDGGTVTLRAEGGERFLTVTVSDNGPGVPKEDIPRLFERFYRVEKARSSDTGGTGLGLAIAKEIIDAHGGDIRIESEPGEGMRVIIDIPYTAALTVKQ